MSSATAPSATPKGLPRKQNKQRTSGRAAGPGRLLVDLPENACRFPVGVATGRLQMFCGRPAVQGAYCAHCGPRTRIAGSAMTKEEAGYWVAVADGRR